MDEGACTCLVRTTYKGVMGVIAAGLRTTMIGLDSSGYQISTEYLKFFKAFSD